MMIRILTACLMVAGGIAHAQQAESSIGLVAGHQALLDARSNVVVLNVAAHPDDESSRTNTVLRRKHGMRIVTVYSTYGGGGQNAIGREIGPALAKIRVRETLRAASMSDVEVRWLGLEDFGYSKTLAETLKFWGSEKLKDRMRNVIDEVDPDVIITNHTLNRGHGHHRASIWAVIEILKERAAKSRDVPRLYARSGLDAAQLSFDTGELDSARGQTYARIAYEAWVQHLSQGPWGPHNPLRVGRDYWRVVYPEGVSDEDAADLIQWQTRAAELGPDPITLSLSRSGRRSLVLSALKHSRVIAQTSSNRRHAVLLHRRAESLQAAYLAMVGVRAEVWLEREDVPLGGIGKGYAVVHGHQLIRNLQVKCQGQLAEPVRSPVRRPSFDNRPRGKSATAPVPKNPADSASGANSKPKRALKAKQADPLPGRYEWTFPCAYGVGDELPSGPEPSRVAVQLQFDLDGEPFTIVEDLPYTPVDPIALHFDREVVLVPRGQKIERMLSIRVESHLDTPVSAAVQLQMGPGIQAVATPGRLELTKEQREARILVRATINSNEMTPDAGLSVGFGEGKIRLPLRLIDIKVPTGIHVGLVRGPEDSTERTLSDLGIEFTSLDRDALVSTQLEQFSVILLDIRAYHHRPELAEVRERLQQYCRSGGRVVSMYHKPGEWNAKSGHPLLAPFALTVGNGRVTEEDAAVTLLNPTHRLMTYPHKVQPSDFDHWVQERGLNFPRTWDAAWQPMLGMKDSGEKKVQESALLYTKYGQGDFVYCSLSLYRQLRRGNQGAVRLLVNLIAR